MTVLLSLLIGLAIAGEPPPTCDASLSTPAESTSVAWVSKLGAHARNNQWLAVVPTSELNAWKRANPSASTGRFLQALGVRKTAKDPKTPYKVVIFDTQRQVLCRPMEGMEPPAVSAGVAVCEARLATVPGTDGCGRAVDRANGDPTTQVFRARWRDLASRGFCVLPVERFLQDR